MTFRTNARHDDEDAIIRDFRYLNIQTGRGGEIYPNRKRKCSPDMVACGWIGLAIVRAVTWNFP